MYGIEIPGLVSLFLLWLIIKYVCKPASRKHNPLPSPRKMPIIGNLHQLGHLPHRNLQSLARKHGPLMLLHFGSVPVLIVFSANAARETIRNHDVNFADRPPYKVLKACFYGGKDIAFSQYGDHWRRARSIFVLKLLSKKRVQSFRSIRDEETALFVKKIGDADLVNFSEMFPQFTNDLLCRSAFGKKYSELEQGKKYLQLVDELMAVMGAVCFGDFIPLLSWFDRISGLNGRIDKVAKGLDDFLETVILEHMESLKQQANFRNKSGENLLDIILDIYNDNITEFSIGRDVIKAIILDVFTGPGTPAVALEWAMTELLANPTVMEKLQCEVRQVVHNKYDHHITDDDLEKMHYLKAVIKETLRLHPPVPVLPHRVASADAIINGYEISAGTVVMINAWAIARDPASWDEPEKFKPERFFNSSIDFKGLDFELIPFGAGRRGCPGIALSMSFIECLLANLMQKYIWKVPDEKVLDMTEKTGIRINKSIPLLAVAINTSLL